jgi:trehalose 6-phosphate synthase
VLRACGGLWVAHGAGDADRQVSDAAGCIPVPPEDARYTLKRVWITKEEEQGYYYGFSNEGLWPLCHLTHERPTFRAGDWEQYVRANRRFANAVLEEIGDEKAVVMVQDYQLALVPGFIKEKRPDLRVGLFWHIPWPNPESFRICPYRVELLQGMLGADLVGFHLQQHCNNFLETVDRMVEAKLDWDRFSAELKGTRRSAPVPHQRAAMVRAWRDFRGRSSRRSRP